MIDFSNYNPRAAIKQLRTNLYVYHSKQVLVKNPKFNKMRQESRLISKRLARMIVRDLQEYKRQFPDLYLQYRSEV